MIGDVLYKVEGGDGYPHHMIDGWVDAEIADFFIFKTHPYRRPQSFAKSEIGRTLFRTPKEAAEDRITRLYALLTALREAEAVVMLQLSDAEDLGRKYEDPTC